MRPKAEAGPNPAQVRLQVPSRKAGATQMKSEEREDGNGWLGAQARRALRTKLWQIAEEIGGTLWTAAATIVKAKLAGIVSIRQQPAAVEVRAVPGHGEGDPLCGPNNSYIASLVERHTRHVMLANVAGKDTRTIVTALIKQATKLPKQLYKSLRDRGKELTDHRRFTLVTKIDVYFYDSQSPWQRGSNENTNGLLRQYFPKATDLSVHSQAYLNKVARH
jgi:IS30 family transposase